MVAVFSKNKRCQALFTKDPAFTTSPAIYFNMDISLAESPFEYEILPDPDIEITFSCGDD